MSTLPTIPTGQLTATGLTLPTASDWLTFFSGNNTTAGVFQVLYGSDVVLTSDTPDGQLINIIIQALLDNQDLVQQVYSSFDIMQAFGTTLDQRLLLGGITRLAGTYSKVNITITATQPVQLYGLDQSANAQFTISDSNNNQWVLVTSFTTAAGSNPNIIFQAVSPGPVTSSVGDITSQTTSVVGITGVTNPSPPYSLGLSEETDAAAKIRFLTVQQGYYTQLYTALMGLPGVSSVNIVENDTSATNASIPTTGTAGSGNQHSIWVIVGGDATNADIATAIYNNRPLGVGMVGSSSATVTRPTGSPFTVYWDVVVGLQIYTLFHVQSIDGVTVPQVAAIEQQLSASATTGDSITASWSTGNTAITLGVNSGNGLQIAAGQIMTATDLAVGTTVSSIVKSGTNYLVTFSPPAPSSGATEIVTFSSQGQFQPGIGEGVNTNEIATLVQDIDSNSFVSFSTPITGGVTATQTNTSVQEITFISSTNSLPPAAGTFELVYGSIGNTVAINWNDPASAIQTKLQGITGPPSLVNVTVSGSIAGGLQIVFTGITVPATILTMTANSTFKDSLGALISMAVTQSSVEIPSSFTGILSTITQQQQANLIPARTVVYPMIIEPAPLTAPNSSWYATVSGANVNTAITVLNSSGSNQQFSVVGGYGPYAYALTTNGSATATCTANGFYTPGATAPATDVVTITDVLGQTAIITITVEA